MSRGAEPARIVLWSAIGALLIASVASAQPEPVQLDPDGPADRVEAYLDRLGLRELRATHLRSLLERAKLEERIKIAAIATMNEGVIIGRFKHVLTAEARSENVLIVGVDLVDGAARLSNSSEVDGTTGHLKVFEADGITARFSINDGGLVGDLQKKTRV